MYPNIFPRDWSLEEDNCNYSFSVTIDKNSVDQRTCQLTRSFPSLDWFSLCQSALVYEFASNSSTTEHIHTCPFCSWLDLKSCEETPSALAQLERQLSSSPSKLQARDVTSEKFKVSYSEVSSAAGDVSDSSLLPVESVCSEFGAEGLSPSQSKLNKIFEKLESGNMEKLQEISKAVRTFDRWGIILLRDVRQPACGFRHRTFLVLVVDPHLKL